jgi:hypothetical protein
VYCDLLSFFLSSLPSLGTPSSHVLPAETPESIPVFSRGLREFWSLRSSAATSASGFRLWGGIENKLPHSVIVFFQSHDTGLRLSSFETSSILFSSPPCSVHSVPVPCLLATELAGTSICSICSFRNRTVMNLLSPIDVPPGSGLGPEH